MENNQPLDGHQRFFKNQIVDFLGITPASADKFIRHMSTDEVQKKGDEFVSNFNKQQKEKEDELKKLEAEALKKKDSEVANEVNDQSSLIGQSTSDKFDDEEEVTQHDLDVFTDSNFPKEDDQVSAEEYQDQAGPSLEVDQPQV